MQKPHRYEALDSLRGVCACMIVLYHLHTPGYISRSALIQHSFLFVDFFFVLSGFVIAASYGKRIAEGFSIRQFMWLRVGRIYPLHLAMLIVFLVFEIAYFAGLLGSATRKPFTGMYGVPEFGYNLTMLQIFFGRDASWNMPSWSIAAEFWTYIIFALFFAKVRRFRPVILLIVAIVCAAYLSVRTDRYISVFHEGALVRCIYGFALGVIANIGLARTSDILPQSRLAISLVEVGFALAIGIMVYAIGGSPISLLMPWMFMLAVQIFALQRGLVSSLLRSRIFVLLGTLSFSIYLTHLFIELRIVNVMTVVQRHLGEHWTLVETTGGDTHIGGTALFGDIMSLITLVLVVAVSWVTYTLIEKPGQRWSREWVLGTRPKRDEVKAEAQAPTF